MSCLTLWINCEYIQFFFKHRANKMPLPKNLFPAANLRKLLHVLLEGGGGHFGRDGPTFQSENHLHVIPPSQVVNV